MTRHYQLPIKFLRSDNGSEFCSTSFRTFCSSIGVKQQLSCPYTAPQNGVVERKHRHIKELGLSLMFQSEVPKHLWSEAFHTAVFVINRLPTSENSNGMSGYRSVT